MGTLGASSVTVYFQRDGQRYGPYTIEQVRAFLEEGRATPADLVWPEGATSWTPLASLLAQWGAPAGGQTGDRGAAEPAPVEAAYHHVAVWKFVVLSICTLGLYGWFWFYRNWKYVRRRDGSQIRPFWRAMFAPFWCYALCWDVQQALGQPRVAGASLVALCYGLLLLAARLPDPGWMVGLLAFAPLLHVVRLIDRFNRQRGARGPHYGRFGLRQVAVALPGGVLLLAASAVTLGLLVPAEVIDGSQLTRGQRDFLRANRIVHADENILYFYSAGLFSIRGDGNLVTDQRVISYYLDDNELVVEAAAYKDITDVRVHEPASASESAELIVTTSADESFTLIIPDAVADRGDFVKKLLERWHAVRDR